MVDNVHQIQHASFIVAMEPFWAREVTGIVFNRIDISLHEMQRSRDLRLPTILGLVSEQRFSAPLSQLLAFMYKAFPIPLNSVPNATR